MNTKTCKTCGNDLPIEQFKEQSYSRKRHLKNPAARRVYHSSCKKCERKWITQYKKTPDGRATMLAANIRSNHGVSISVHDIRKLDATTCYICGDPITSDAELDHVIPKSQGGQTVVSNLKWTHRQCNRIKHDLNTEQLIILLQRILSHHTSLISTGR